MGSEAIRAGRAYVELFADDRALREALAHDETAVRQSARRMSTDGQLAVRSMSQQTAALHAAASHSLATSAATGSAAVAESAVRSVSSLATIRGGIGGVAQGFVSASRVMTASLARVIGTLGLLQLGLAKAGAGNALAPLYRSGSTIGGIGVLSSLAGAVTGSQALRSSGTMLRRVGLGAQIAGGFANGGLLGAARAGIPAAAGYAATSATVAALRLPGLAARGTGYALSGLGQGLGVVFPALRSTSTAAAAMTSALASGRGVALSLLSTLPAMGLQVVALGKTFLGFGAAVTVAGLTAAKQFASAAVSMQKEAAETGKSLEMIIGERYGALGQQLISTEDIASASRLQKAFDELGTTIKLAWAQVGIAVTPLLTQFIQTTTDIVNGMARWAAQNRETVGTIFRVAGVTGLLAAAVGSLVAGLYLAGPLVGLLISPIGLLVAGVVELTSTTIAWSTHTQTALQSAAKWFNDLYNIAAYSLVGIGDALASGNLGLAMKIGMAGLENAWLHGIAGLQHSWIDWTGWALKQWWQFTGGFEDAWHSAISAVTTRAVDMLTSLHRGLIDIRVAIGELSAEDGKLFKGMLERGGNAIKAALAPPDNAQRDAARANMLKAAQAGRHAAVDVGLNAAEQQLLGLLGEARAERERMAADLANNSAAKLATMAEQAKTSLADEAQRAKSVQQFGGFGLSQNSVQGLAPTLLRENQKQTELLGVIVRQNNRILAFGE